MPKTAVPALSGLLHNFFHQWLAEQRDASHRTVLAYRDAWKLFLCFVAASGVTPNPAIWGHFKTGHIKRAKGQGSYTAPEAG